MKSKQRPTGVGSQCPPDEVHVRVYFSQQGATKVDAQIFFHHYETKMWKNDRGGLIKNWKKLAWSWIW
jgi:hypothetical protein